MMGRLGLFIVGAVVALGLSAPLSAQIDPSAKVVEAPPVQPAAPDAVKPDLLPDPVEFAWLVDRLGESHADAVTPPHAEYLLRYQEVADNEAPVLRNALSKYEAVTFPLIRDIRALLRVWERSHRSLQIADEWLWSSIESAGVEVEVVKRASAERRCGFLDLPVLNAIPEHKFNLRDALVEAQIDGCTPAVADALFHHHVMKTAALQHRIEVLETTLAEFEESLRAQGMTDDNRAELSAAFMSGVLNYCLVSGCQRLYKANARLAQQVRRDIETVRSLLDEDAAERFESFVEQQLYPEVAARTDPNDSFIKVAEETAEGRDLLVQYRRERRLIEERIIERVQRYRDEWLCLWGRPMLYKPMTEYDADMEKLRGDLTELESRYQRPFEVIKANTDGGNDERSDKS